MKQPAVDNARARKSPADLFRGAAQNESKDAIQNDVLRLTKTLRAGWVQ